MTSFGFDTANTKPAASFDPMPPGWYAMRISKAEQVEGQKAETGLMLKVELEVIADRHVDFANRKVWCNFCCHHQSQQTREIARSQVASILEAIGKKGASSIDDMLGGELLVKVSVRPADGTYDARNEAKGFKALDGAAPAGGAQKAAPAAAAPAARSGWKR